MAPTDQQAPVARRIHWPELLITWAVLTAVSVAGSLLLFPHVMPRAASSTMHLIILTVVVFSVTAAPVGSLVYATLFYGLRHWKHSSGDEPPPDGPPMRGNTPVIIVWIGISCVIGTFLLIWGLAAMAADSADAAHPALTVDVTGQQWLWTFHYPGTDVTTSQLVLPEGKTVTFDVTSLDVVHGFWIVQMGVKVDANPGQVTTVSVTPDKAGTFTVVCSELCGLNHAFMRAPVRVLPDNQFKSWLASQE